MANLLRCIPDAYVAAGLLAALALLPAAPAGAADVTVTSAKIAAGKLVITGTTTTPNTRVRLDGQTSAAFNVISGPNPNRAFSFKIVYHPGDCIVSALCINRTKTAESQATSKAYSTR